MRRFGGIQLLLLAGLIHGLLYVFLFPPWQHYDEPGHFEVIWLIAKTGQSPSPGEYDQSMRREVAASMLEHGFFHDLSIRPDLLAEKEPIWIGFSQTDSFSLYYWLAALPLKVFTTSDVAFQLYLCRIVSLLFYLLTLLAAYGIVSEISPAESPTRWLFPAVLILLPGFNDLMTAGNSDVGAVAFFSMYLWAGIRLIRLGFSIPRLITVILLAIGCFYTKNTAALAVPLLVFPLLFSLFRRHRQPIAWVIIVIAIFIGIFFFITTGDVAYWYQPVAQVTPTRVATSQTSLGAFAFQLDTSSGTHTNNLIQLLPSSQVQQFRGKIVTIGYWIWANQPVKHHSPLLESDTQVFSESVEITQKPVFHAFTAKIASNTRHLKIVLEAPKTEGVVIYFDGLILAKGDFSQSGKPIIGDSEAQQFTWNHKTLTNPIHNASAEQVWPRPRATILRLLDNISPLQPNMVLASMADWENSKWYYRASLEQLFRTYWGQFGWGHIAFSRNIYIALSIFTLMGIFGATIRFFRCIKNISWDIFLFAALAILGIWGAALVRGIHSIAGTIFIPSARYAFPAVIPTTWILWSGWTEWLHLFARWHRIPQWIKASGILIPFIVLDVLSIITITRFYYP